MRNIISSVILALIVFLAAEFAVPKYRKAREAGEHATQQFRATTDFLAKYPGGTVIPKTALDQFLFDYGRLAPPDRIPTPLQEISGFGEKPTQVEVRLGIIEETLRTLKKDIDSIRDAQLPSWIAFALIPFLSFVFGNLFAPSIKALGEKLRDKIMKPKSS